MKEKNTKVNLILSIISFSLTSFLLIMITLAWYATNKVALVTAGIGHTKGDDYSLTLERGEYSNSTWNWEETNDLSITKLQPGDSYFFRFKIEYEAKVNFETSFSDISSSLVENSLIAYGNHVRVNSSGVDIFNITGNVVNITEVVNGVNQTPKQLYSISSGIVSLDTEYYNVADTFILYDYGVGSQTFINDNVISASDKKENDTETTIGQSILTSNPTIRYDLSSQQSSSGTVYGYFALEFNDSLSTKTYIHLDGQTYSDSNLYQCQSLKIGSIALVDVTEVNV